METTITTESGEVITIPWIEEDLKENEFFKFEEYFEPHIPTATLEIYKWISENMKRSESRFVNRGSSADMCIKRRIFQQAGAESTPLTPRKRMRFALGDMVEYLVIYFIEQALTGEGKLYSEILIGQKNGYFEIARGGGEPLKINLYQQLDTITKLDNGLDIFCHADGWGKLNSTGEWELIEVKSCNKDSFKRYVKQGPDGYKKQAHANMMSDKSRELGVKNTRFYFCNINTGNLWSSLLPFSENVWLETQEEYKKVASTTTDIEKFPAPYSLAPYFPLINIPGKQKRVRDTSSKLLEAQFPCSYCPYLKQCHGDFTIEWEGEKPHKIFNYSNYEK